MEKEKNRHKNILLVWRKNVPGANNGISFDLPVAPGEWPAWTAEKWVGLHCFVAIVLWAYTPVTSRWGRPEEFCISVCSQVEHASPRLGRMQQTYFSCPSRTTIFLMWYLLGGGGGQMLSYLRVFEHIECSCCTGHLLVKSHSWFAHRAARCLTLCLQRRIRERPQKNTPRAASSHPFPFSLREALQNSAGDLLNAASATE